MSYFDPSLFANLPQQPSDGTGQPSALGDQLELRRYLGQLGMANPVQPQLIPSPGLRLGPVHLSGQGLDSAAISVLGMLQGMQQPRGFGANFATGLAAGLAGGRARMAQVRGAANEQAVQSAAEQNRLRQQEASAFASKLAQWRHSPERAAASADMFRLPDGTMIPMTAAIANGLATKQGVIPKPEPKPVPGSISPDISRQAKSIAKAIVEGRQPPSVTGLGRTGLAGEIKRVLEDDYHYDQATATQDFDATKAFLRSANNPLSVRMRTSAATAMKSLDLVDRISAQLAKESPEVRGYFSPLNRATLTAAMNAPNDRARSLARQLDGQIATIAFELGNVNMGGNSPTDQGMLRAAKELASNWDEKVLKDMTNLARENLRIRLNSINQVGAYTTRGLDLSRMEAPLDTTVVKPRGSVSSRYQ